ncbi:HesA/MoeB/ThiF family protein [Clostridium sp. DL1XJH146]
MQKRYEKNMSMLSEEENNKLKDFKVCVIGCGGLGGYIIEMLGRLGIGHITVVDGDTFDETNLNRQLLSDEKALGMNKAKKAEERMKTVNSSIKLMPIDKMFNVENGEEILKGHDVIVDALDSIDARLLLQELCEKLEIPMVHGAISGWYGQVTTILPGDRTLNFLYNGEKNKQGNKEKVDLGNPSFTPAQIASIQVSEALKLLLKRGKLLSKRILFVDLLEQEFDIIDL